MPPALATQHLLSPIRVARQQPRSHLRSPQLLVRSVPRSLRAASSARTISTNAAIRTGLAASLPVVARRSLRTRHRTARQKLQPRQLRCLPSDELMEIYVVPHRMAVSGSRLLQEVGSGAYSRSYRYEFHSLRMQACRVVSSLFYLAWWSLVAGNSGSPELSGPVSYHKPRGCRILDATLLIST